jgi:predicted GNAT family acetyltransferase
MVESVDLETFEARHGRALSASIVEHSRFAFLLPRLKAGGASGHARLWSAGGESACALLYRGTLVLGDLGSTAIDAIVQDTLARDLRQIGGPEPAVTRAVEKCGEAGVAFSTPLVMHTMVLRQKPMDRSTKGCARLADMRDFKCVRRWLSDFQREALPDQEMPPQSAQDERCRHLIDAGSIVLWERDDTPVSMAALVQDLEHIAAISLVYTPARGRGRGYAGAAVAMLSARIVESGRPACLFVDARNAISTRCYARIGYVQAAVHANAFRVESKKVA